MLGKYSIGLGDRFARQGRAQLAAVVRVQRLGIQVTPVWNKSHREHTTIGSMPSDVRREADDAVRALDWSDAYYVDADHIGLGNVDLFIGASDFFTLDVADFIGRDDDSGASQAFIHRHRALVGRLDIPGLDGPLEVTQTRIESIARKYLPAVREAARIYRRIESARGAGAFLTEVSMDETDQPQTPIEMLVILAAIADEGIPAQTIAPKFTGRFNKGVDYAGDVVQFAREFEQDLCMVAFAVRQFGLPPGLKLSVHSGSDKFSIYGPIREALVRHDAGLHLKTAGTTWLEELIGLSLSGKAGLDIARDVYRDSLARFDELCAPYASVIAIDRAALPSPEAVDNWTGEAFADALRHDPSCERFNPSLRQLLHVGYKVAAEMGARYLDALEENEPTIAKCVTENLFERHIRPLFLDR